MQLSLGAPSARALRAPAAPAPRARAPARAAPRAPRAAGDGGDGGDAPDARVVREFRENADGSVSETPAPAAPPRAQVDLGGGYADPSDAPPRREMSKEQQAKLRAEYVSFGGAPNKAMGGNYFLYIILAVAVLAVLSSALGYLG
jgi:hypothetical protein